MWDAVNVCVCACWQVGNQETMSVVSFSVDNESGKLSHASTTETAPFKACNISYIP